MIEAMRNMKYSPIAMAALLLLAACGQREIDIALPEEVPAAQKKVHFTTGTVQTRTAFGEAVEEDGKVLYPTYWTANDRAVSISMNYELAVTAGVNSDETDGEGHITRASFDASFEGIDATAPYKFYLVSPASAFVWPSANRGAVSVSIPGRQTPTVGSIDEAAQIIAAVSEEYADIPSESVDVSFNHLTAYGKLTLKNVNPGEGVTVESVTLWSAEQPLAGSWYYKFADGSIEAKEASSSLVIDAANIDIPAEDPVWFACAAVDMGGKPLKVSVNLSNGKALVRTITLNQNVDFAAGKIVKFSINMASAELVDQAVMTTNETVYQLVTSIDQLAVGDEVVFADGVNPAYVMAGTGLNGVARDSGFTFGNDGYIRITEGSTVTPVTLDSKSGSNVTWKNTAGRNLRVSNRAVSWSTSSSTWTLSFSSDVATMSCRSGFSNYYLYCDNGTFSVSTSQASFAIFKKITIPATVSFDLSGAPVLEFDDYGAYLTDRTLVYNGTTDQLSREYEADGTLTFAIIGPAESQLLEFAGIPSDATLGTSFPIRVTYVSGALTVLESTYNVIVAREDGPTLWLADVLGNGFIVKR